MNFLAHLWLADRTRTSLAGSVLGDVVRGRDLSAYPPDIAQGIVLHRRVDAATDRHPLVVAARCRFPDGERRYAGIVLDLALDHLLARQWPHFHPEPLLEFTQRAGASVETAGEWFERGGGWRPHRFAALLHSYASARGLERAYRRTAARLSDPAAFLRAAQRSDVALTVLTPSLRMLLDDLAAVMLSARTEP